MPKPCDTHAIQLPCVHFGKCYGYASFGGKSGKPKPMHEVGVCPYLDDVRDWWRKNGRSQNAQRNAGGGVK